MTIEGAVRTLSVVQTLKDAGFYQEGEPEDLKSQFVEQDQINLGGKTYSRSKFSRYDIKVFADQLENKIEQLDPLIQAVYAKNAVLLLSVIRIVNNESKQGFKGSAGSGNELDFIQLAARSFYDPDPSATARTKWSRPITSTGSKWFIEGLTSGANLIMGEEEALIVLAMFNPATNPCVDAVQVTKNSDSKNLDDLDFVMLNEEKGSPLIELKIPLILPPEETGRIAAYYFQTGTDEMQPIGLWIVQAKNLRDLTDIATLA